MFSSTLAIKSRITPAISLILSFFFALVKENLIKV